MTIHKTHGIRLVSGPIGYGKTSFFFESYCDHRDLHSFPTRRSSDLKQVESKLAETFVGGATVGRVSGTPFTEDRKSTRLNSSHLGISYAVFCLKKKKDDSPLHHRHGRMPQ